MIAKITRGSRAGDIGAYLHGPGKANEHVYYDTMGQQHSGGQVIGSNIGAEGQTDPARWVPELRAAQQTRPEITKGIWQASLRNTANDRVLSNDEWAEVAQSFAEKMGFENHPWVAVRHGADHVHIVVSRVDYEGNVWHGRNDRRQAQTACQQLERTHGLEVAARRRTGPKQTVTQVRTDHRRKAALSTLRRHTAEKLRPRPPGQDEPRSKLPERTREEQQKAVREAVAKKLAARKEQSAAARSKPEIVPEQKLRPGRGPKL